MAGLALLAAGIAASWILRRPRDVRREAGLSVLLITIDTLRADALGAYGNTRVETPWIDRLAREGVRFDAAHSHNVVTLPSHSNILSGRYPLDHGVRDNSGFRFPRETETLATLLQGRGYRTGAFVSAFPLASRFGLGRGFDVYDDHFLTAENPAERAAQERPGAETVAAALRWLEAQGNHPVFLWVHLYEPHYPYAPPEPFASRYREDLYHGEVAAADSALKPLLEPLLLAGRDGRTLVVLTGDHGESLGEHGEKTHGIFAYEGPLRVPLVLFCPRLLAPAVVGGCVRHVDILPSVLDALALDSPTGLPGTSLLPRAAGRDTKAGPSYFEALSGMMNRRWAPLRGVISGTLKYVDLPLPELYDLASDPREERNLAAERPEALEAMRAELARERAGDREVARTAESAETRERLRSLGYLAATDAGVPKERYTPEDDPKRLIALDAELQVVTDRSRAGDPRGALALCQEIVGRRPGMPLSLVHLASLQRDAGDLPGAISSAGRALALNPEDPQTAAALGSYLAEAGRLREALAVLEPYAKGIDPNPDVLFARGAALAQLGRRSDALEEFARVRTLDPGNPMGLVSIGTVHLMGRDYARAKAAFDEALAMNPRVARAHNGLGVIAAETGRPDEAIEHWRRAVELDPREFDTLFNLGSLLVKEGRAAEAVPFLARFERQAPPALYAGDLERVRGWLRQAGGQSKKP